MTLFLVFRLLSAILGKGYQYVVLDNDLKDNDLCEGLVDIFFLIVFIVSPTDQHTE
jgi:hypothetical protein